MRAPIILYDADCGFCTWSMSKVLAWDRRGRLRPVALQDPESDLLLSGMDPERRMASWHLVDRGEVHSAGAAIAPLMRHLRGGAPIAAAVSSFPRLAERGYGWVADNRGSFGRLVRRIAGAGAVERATARIDERARRPERR